MKPSLFPFQYLLLIVLLLFSGNIRGFLGVIAAESKEV
jgi:hypothetical protein